MVSLSGVTPDATTTTKGKIQLAGDLAGTSALPVIGTNKVTFDKANTGFVIQQVGTQFGAVGTTTTPIPVDDTIPQITEGAEFMTQTITPLSATSRLYVEVTATISASIATHLQAALFRDATANAIAVSVIYQNTATGIVTITFSHVATSGSTSATTFRVRCGADAAGTLTFNGAGGTRRYGGITLSSMTITEIK